MTRSIEQLKSQIGEAKNLQLQLAAGHTVVEIDPTLVERSFVVDRMARTLEEDLLLRRISGIRASWCRFRQAASDDLGTFPGRLWAQTTESCGDPRR